MTDKAYIQEPRKQLLKNVVRVNVKDLAAKMSDKREVYNFVTLDLKAYVPPYDNVTIYFLKDLMSGRKKRMYFLSYLVTFSLPVGIPAVDALHYNVPYYETLTVKKLLEKWIDDPRVYMFIPDEEDRDKLPREWLFNVMYTNLKSEFSDYVVSKIIERNAFHG